MGTTCKKIHWDPELRNSFITISSTNIEQIVKGSAVTQRAE